MDTQAVRQRHMSLKLAFYITPPGVAFLIIKTALQIPKIPGKIIDFLLGLVTLVPSIIIDLLIGVPARLFTLIQFFDPTRITAIIATILNFIRYAVTFALSILEVIIDFVRQIIGLLEQAFRNLPVIILALVIVICIDIGGVI